RRERAVFMVASLDHLPRRLARARLPQRILGNVHELVVMLEALPVSRPDAPRGRLVPGEVLQALLLRLLRKVEPELHEERALGDQHPLEVPDALEAPRELAAFLVAHHALQDRIGVPGAEKDADVSLRRKLPPEAPHFGPLALELGRRPERARADMARVHPFVEEVHGLALAGAIHPVYEDHDGEVALVEEPVLEPEEALAQLRLLALELGFRELVADLGGFEHGVSSSPFSGRPSSPAGRVRRGGARSARPWLRRRARARHSAAARSAGTEAADRARPRAGPR